MKVVEALAHILKREGVEYLFAYPLNPLIEAAAALDIRPIIVRQERTGLHMADAFSRLGGGKKIGVFVMQQGPGSENSFGGVAQAYSESVPILIIPAGHEHRMMHRFPNFNSSRSYRDITKHCEPLTSADAVFDVMRRAFSELRNGRPGPVLVEIPADVYGQEVNAKGKYASPQAVRTAPDPAAVSKVAEVLAAAERPVIYAGQGVHYAKAWTELKDLAETWSIPVCTSLEGKSAFPEDHPLALGAGGRAVPKPVRHFLNEADVILGIGCSFASTPFGVAMPAGKTFIHATLDPLDLYKDLSVQHALLGDARLCLIALSEALHDEDVSKATSRSTRVADEIASIRKSWLAEWSVKRDSNAMPLNPYRVLRDLEETVNVANTIITHDSGSPRDQLSPFWKSLSPLGYLGWGKSTQLGYGLGLAMGAKLACPEKLCINVWGDAAIGFTGMDFETAVREQIPILSILLNNFSMAIELPIMPVSTEKFRSTDISGNYADFAKALGGYGERVTTPTEIVPAIKRGITQIEAGHAVLLEFITSKELEISI